MDFDIYEAYEEFGEFTVTIDAEYNRADVWLDDHSVNLEYVVAGILNGNPEEDEITEAVWDTSKHLAKRMEDWAYSTDLY